ncbi:MAG: glycerophosphodiester phosphodiesterase family protein [Bacteroidota bacterium]
MRFRIIFLLFVIFSCSKKEKYEAIQLFGHAGNGLNISNSVYHDNSENSIKLALAQNGCDGVEVDVQLSKDGIAWLFHDQNLEKETNLNSCINSLSDEEIESLSYNHFNDEKLIKLKDLQLKGKSVVLDLRHSNSCENKVVDVNQMIVEIELFRQKNSESEIYLNTNYLAWLTPLQSLNLKLCYSPSENENLDEIVNTYGVKCFLFKNQEITKERVETEKNKGNEIIIFEVRSPKGIRSALNKYPTIILSDDVKAAIVEKF